MGELTLAEGALLTVAGLAAGIVNTLVGGGTSIVVPLLVLGFGVDPHSANGTNRVAVCFQGMAALWTLLRAPAVAGSAGEHPRALSGDHDGVHDGVDRGARLVRWSEIATPALLALLGGIPGALIAAHMPADDFKRWAGILLLAAILFFFIRPQRSAAEAARSFPRGAACVAFLLGVYGGFLGAGVGVLILILLRPLLGVPLLRVVPIKVAMVFLLSLSASVVYVYEGQVRWDLAPPLIVSNVVGGIVGAKLALLGGDRWIRRILAVVAAALALRLIWAAP